MKNGRQVDMAKDPRVTHDDANRFQDERIARQQAAQDAAIRKGESERVQHENPTASTGSGGMLNPMAQAHGRDPGK